MVEARGKHLIKKRSGFFSGASVHHRLLMMNALSIINEFAVFAVLLAAGNSI